MKNNDLESALQEMDVPRPDPAMHQQALKVPLLSYRRSSAAGLWFLAVPAVFLLTTLFKYQLMVTSPLLDAVEGSIRAIDHHPLLTYLIPVLFAGLPLAGLIMNLLAVIHFAYRAEAKELLVTVKVRPLNIMLCLVSFAVLVYLFTPDAMP